jgi:hypothetical protein
MLRLVFKRNLLPIALITIGCLIFLAIILYLFRAHLATVGWILFGLFLIGLGVAGLVVNNPKRRSGAGAKPAPSAPVSPGASSSPKSTPGYTAARMRETKPAPQASITLSQPVLIGAGVLVASLILMLLCNVGTVLHSLLTVSQTHIVDCREASHYAEDGWQFVSAYSYRLGDEVVGYTEYTDCVLERERFVWAKDERIAPDEAAIDEALITEVSIDGLATDDGFGDENFAGDVPVSTQSAMFTQTPVPQWPATQEPFPTFTVESVSSPMPTWTPPPTLAPFATSTPTVAPLPMDTSTPAVAPLPINTFTPTATPLVSSPTSTPIPRTDVEVCTATLDDTYLETFVQWIGTIVEDPIFEDDGQWFQVEWTNADFDSECERAVFFVSYTGKEDFFAEDVITVIGTIIETAHEYEGESGQTEYAVVVRANYVEFYEVQ